MNEQFWKERWSNNQIGFHQADANAMLVRGLEGFGLREGARVLVPLCGKSLDMRWLAAQGCRVVGAELSALAVEQFYAELGVRPQMTEAGALRRYEAAGVTIFQGSIFELTSAALGPVEMVYDRAALVALPQPMRERYAAHLVEITGGAPQLLICFEYEQSCAEGPPFSVTEAEVRRVYAGLSSLTLLERRAVEGGIKGRCPATEAAWRLQP